MEKEENSMEQLENYTQYWNLINVIDGVCDEFFYGEENCLYMDDVISALGRVKDHWQKDQVKWQIRNEEDELDDVCIECREKEKEEENCEK